MDVKGASSEISDGNGKYDPEFTEERKGINKCGL